MLFGAYNTHAFRLIEQRLIKTCFLESMCLNGAKSIKYPAVPYSELYALWSLIINIESGIIESFILVNITTNFKINNIISLYDINIYNATIM